MNALSSKHKLLLYGSYIEKVFVFLTFKYLNSCVILVFLIESAKY